MRQAIRSAYAGIRKDAGGPFGAVIVRKGKVIASAHNTVLRSQDPTCHAEVNAIRLASKQLKHYILEDCEIYSTTEPCPMCFSAIHWARIRKVFFGTTIRDAARLGFNEMPVRNIRLRALGKSPLQIRENFLRRECLRLFRDWEKIGDRIIY